MIPNKQPTIIELILIEAKKITTDETQARADLSEARMKLNQIEPRRLKLVKQALSNNIIKEDFTTLLKELRYTSKAGDYQALRQFNHDTGAVITDLTTYKQKLKEIEKTPSPKELQAKGRTQREARVEAKELKIEAKKKSVNKIPQE